MRSVAVPERLCPVPPGRFWHLGLNNHPFLDKLPTFVRSSAHSRTQAKAQPPASAPTRKFTPRRRSHSTIKPPTIALAAVPVIQSKRTLVVIPVPPNDITHAGQFGGALDASGIGFVWDLNGAIHKVLMDAGLGESDWVRVVQKPPPFSLCTDLISPRR